MKLLVTGGCGFLGSNLAATAIQRGDSVVVFDNLSRLGSAQNLEWLKGLGKFVFVQGDIRNPDAVADTVRSFRPDAIFHLAGQVAMTTSISNPRMDFEINALGTLNLLEAVRQHSPDSVILYSSTNKVYGDLEQFTYRETETRYECVEKPNGFDEGVSLDFHSPYGCSKGAADQYMLDYARIFGLKTIVFRHSSMYGGRQFATADQGWVGWFCQKAIEIKRGKIREFSISGSGKQVRDVLHADDMSRLYFSCLKRAENLVGQAFNIGGGMTNSLSLLELFALLESHIGVKVVFLRGPVRESDQRVFVANLAKINKAINWLPVVSANEGVAKMLTWTETAIGANSA